MYKRHIILATIISLFVILTVPAAALGAANNEDAMYDAGNATTAFYGYMQDHYSDTSAEYYQEFQKQAEHAQTELARAAAEFNTSGLQGREATAVQDMRQATLHDEKAIGDWRKAVAANDLRGANRASAADDQASHDFNDAYEEYTKAHQFFTNNQYKLFYWVVLGVMAVITLVTLQWFLIRNYGCTHKKSASEQALDRSRRHLLLASLGPVAGAAITVATYYHTIGNTYLVMWGAVVFGLAYFVRELLKHRELATAK